MILKNITLVSPGIRRENTELKINNGIISENAPVDDAVIDGAGLTAVPGFFDIHVHGGNSFDFCDDTPDAIRNAAEYKVKEGVTSLLATTLTLPEEKLHSVCQRTADYRKNPSGAKIHGIHLEGPFINPHCTGAQNPAFVKPPDDGMVKRLHAVCPVKKISFAPELPGSGEFIREMIKAGITPSAVHTAATYSDVCKAMEYGLRDLSHFCNQMTPLHHRDVGCVGAGLLHQELNLELISDGLHVCPDMIKLILHCRGTKGLMIITDAMRAAGLPDGKSSLGGLDVIVRNGEARLASNGALAGSTLKFNLGLKRIYELSGLPLEQVIACSSWNQAQSLNMQGIGKLEPGYAADVVLLDPDFCVRYVFVDGKLKYKA